MQLNGFTDLRLLPAVLDLRRNPIAWAEYLHLRRMQKVSRRWARWLSRASRVTAVILAALVILCAPFIYRLPPDYLVPDSLPMRGVAFAVLMLVVLSLGHYGATLRRLNSGCVESIARERTGRTWESLLLTNIDSRQLVLGKWWGAFCVVWRDVLLVSVLRGASILGIASILIPLEVYREYYLMYNRPPPAEIFPPFLPTLRDIALALVLNIVLTFISVWMTSAYSMVNAMSRRAWNWRGALAQVGMGCLLPLLVGAACVASIFLASVLNPAIQSPGSDATTPFGMAAWSMVDTGLLLTGALANPYDANEGAYLAAALVTLVIFGLIAVGILRAAEWLAVQQNVNPHEEES